MVRRWIAGALWYCVACAQEDELEQLTESLRGGDSAWLDVRRSLAVTDLQILQRFRLERVLNTLARELGAGLIWPPSLGFVHVSEVQPEPGEDGQRYRSSPQLDSTFLPLRARVMFDFLKERPWRRRAWWGWSIGGRSTH